MSEKTNRFVAPKQPDPKVLRDPQSRSVKHGKPFFPWHRKSPLMAQLQPEFREMFEAVHKKNPYSTDSARLLSILAAIGDRAFFRSGRESKNSLGKNERWNNDSSVVELYLYEMDLLKIAGKVRGLNSVYFRNVGLKAILDSDLSDPAVVSSLVEKWVVEDSV